MKKFIKSLALALALTAAVVCAGIFAAACDKDGGNDGGDKYSVYVVYENGTAVNGHTDGTGYDMKTNTESAVYVKWCKGTRCPDPVLLGTDGKASIDAATLEAALDGKPDYVEVLYVKNFSDANNVSAHVEITGTGEVKITVK